MTYKGAQNEFSCALACIVSLAKDNHINAEQEDVCRDYANFFPEWVTQKGVLSRMGIVRLMEAMELVSNFVLMTQSRSEFLDTFTRLSGEKRFVGAFVLLQSPDHCLRIFRVSGDGALAFEPVPLVESQPGWMSWASVESRKPEYLLFGN